MLTRFANVFFFNDTATTEIYTLSLHDALPIFDEVADAPQSQSDRDGRGGQVGDAVERIPFAPAEGANGGDDAEQPSMKGHPAFPDRQELRRMFEVVGQVVEEDIAESASENHTQSGVQDEVVQVFDGELDVAGGGARLDHEESGR